MTWLQPVTLRGARATLEPLAHSHGDDLIAAVKDGELWKLWYTTVPEPARHRASRRQARRHPAQPQRHAQRHAARHLRLQHHRPRVADGEGASRLPAEPAAGLTIVILGLACPHTRCEGPEDPAYHLL